MRVQLLPRFWPSFVLAFLVAATWARPAGGQITPQCVSGCLGTVSVTPDGTSLGVAANSSGNHAIFFVDYSSGTTSSLSFTYTCTSTGGVTCGLVVPASGTLTGPDDFQSVNVTFSVGATGGRLTLLASHGTGSVEDTGFFTIVVQSAPGVVLRNHNRDNVDRSLCLTAGAGEAAAWSCGDLVISHSMPGFTTMGRDRALTLIHNSGTAYARPAVAAAVTESGAQPTTVFANLFVGGVSRNSASYGGWANATRQIVLDFNGVSDATGAYPIELRVQNQYPGATFETIIKDTLLIVNRFVDEFGAGFGIAGVERLFFNQPVGTNLGHILWVGGDGSARLYRKLTASTWLGAPGAFQDTLSLSGGVYTRSMRHGIKVKFNSAGRDSATINRAGQQTTFTYNAAGDRLVSIQVPPACGAACTYTLAYDGNANLAYIQDPAARRLTAFFQFNDGRLTSLTDPDGKSVQFGWDGDRRVISRTGRAGFTTTYEYSLGRAVGSRITKVTVPIGRIVGDNATAVTTFDNWNDKGLAVAGTGQVAVATTLAYTKVFGPRYPGVADTAAFTVDRWGAPTKTVNAIGATTNILRGDASHPALVTKVTYPNARITSMSYNTRGNLQEIRDSTSHLATGLPTKSTTYTYGTATPDSPTIVADRFGRTIKYTYTGLGLTDSIIDSRLHRTKFLYDSTSTIKGVVKQIIERQVETWRQSDSTVQTIDQIYRFAYDTKGNAKVDTVPNKTVTSYVRDAVGRATDVYDVLGTRRKWVYDSLNRVTQTVQYTAPQVNPYGLTLAANCDATQVVCTDQTRDTLNPVLSGTLTTNYRYSAIDLDTIVDPRLVTRKFSHDARGLVWKEIDDLGAARTARYGPGGTLDTSTSRSGLIVTYLYDALGRRSQMNIPSRAWTGGCNGNAECAQFHTMPAETINYTYDSLNNLLTVTGGQGTITRKYYQNGALRMKITNMTGLGLDTLIYSYDTTGALLQVINGRDMRDTTDYIYSRTTGDLDSMIVRYGTPVSQKYSFRFLWDGLGRRKQILYPITTGTKRMTVTLRYDAAGSLRRVQSAHPDSTPAVSNRLNFTYRNERADAIGRILKQATTCRMLNGADALGSPCSGAIGVDSTTNRYNRLSMLVKQTHIFGTTNALDSMGYDASGNLAFRRDGLASVFHSFTMRANSNQMMTDVQNGTSYSYTYTADGSRLHEFAPSLFYSDRYYYYDGVDRISGTLRWVVQGQALIEDSPNSCLYDPDLQMTKPCDNGAPKLGFDGNNVVVAGPNAIGWSFVHGPALDDPLIGLARWPTGNRKVFFWVTDGQGRHLSFADSTGWISQDDYNLRYGQDGGKYAGGTSSASSFQADRFSTPAVPGISFFRNRAYDKNTGRWTQEDPIGIAGGLNLYQFNGNNPVAYTDPFGLCPQGNSVCPLIEFTTTVLGGIGGFIAGGGSGAALAAATAGGGLVAIPTLAVQGAAGGAAGGLALGKAITGAMFSEDNAGGGSSGGSAEPGRNETGNFGYAAKKLGLDKNEASDALHAIKKAAGLKGRDNVIINTETGDVLNKSREVIGNLRDGP